MLVNKILLLPGMDGTGKLLLDFSHALAPDMRREISIYLSDKVLSYEDLAKLVRYLCDDPEPFVLLAESFSTPLAIRIAAEKPANLKALILCAGFAASPARGLTRWLGWILAPALMRRELTGSTIRSWLIGADAPEPLVMAVREAMSSVRPEVLTERLRAILTCDARSALSQISVPMLYLQARHDRLVPGRCFEEIRHINTAIRCETVDGPHLLLQREPVKTAQIVTQFLERL